jgi:hypothetical protein
MLKEHIKRNGKTGPVTLKTLKDVNHRKCLITLIVCLRVNIADLSTGGCLCAA